MSPFILLLTALAQSPTPSTEEAESPWTGDFGLGASFFTGNSRAFTLTGDALAEYESPAWALTLEADGAYGKAASEGDAEREVTAQALGGWGRGERRFTQLLSAFALVGAAADHPASLELRTEAELGAGFTLLEQEREEKELFLRAYVGGSYARDRRFQYAPTREDLPDVTLWSPALGATFRYDVNERVHLREDALLLPDIFGDSRVLVDSTTKLSVDLTDRFALTTFFALQHDSAPAAGKVRTDTSLSLGAELSL
ncbi:DUF481 domain-containing protein [Corallococcus sp. CA053C]|uniref:DUF481 domain-containing protein n=1 Tax=Corallococcus sp. CA053C TaxID=2316732 RepID=UPI000EA0D3EC|nr:DUF481 domain-containing protein [Corallococcus sp. CA053C]RKH00792.1 DUF481 domain-containing protein [Corallococcus sp. CA053C]